MKTAAALLGCFVLAFVLGRWGLEEQLRQREREITRLKQEMKQRRINPLGGVNQMLHLEPRDPPRVLEPPPPAEPASGATNRVETAAEPEERPRRRRRDRPMAERLDQAFELWQTRSRIARATFLSNIEATPEQAERFDTLVAAMNLQIEDTIRIWAEAVKEQGAARPEDGARLMHEITGAVVRTYDEIGESLPGGWRARAGDDFKLFDYVDPNVGRSLIEVESLLDGRGPW